MNKPATLTLYMPHMVMIPLGHGLYRSAAIDAFHVKHKVPKIDFGGTVMGLAEVENVALTMLHMVRTHPDNETGRLLSETPPKSTKNRRRRPSNPPRTQETGCG